METIEIGFSPEKAKQGLDDLNTAIKGSALTFEKALGKDANDSINKFQDAADNGTKKVAKFFQDMGKRVKDDLKTAFNVTGILEGSKFVSEMNQGIRSTFEMERAFSRLQVRLQLTNKEFIQLKSSMGSKVAATGQSLQSVLPGVDIAASRGGIRDVGQLSVVAESLGKARATTGEETGEMSEAVIEILKDQGKAITGASFKATLDALQGTRVAGAFATTGEAGRAVEDLAPYAKKMGLDTRQMGGMAAAASGAGSSGLDILKKLMERGSDTLHGGDQLINSMLGTNVFSHGKINMQAFQNIKQDRFGGYSQQIMSDVTGLTGANGADLTRFLNAMKEGSKKYTQVTQGSNETGAQFKIAADNFAAKMDQFKMKIVNATRQVGEGLSAAANSVLDGKPGEAIGGLKQAGKSISDNRGVLLGGAILTGAAGLLMGGGVNRLLGGAGGALGGMAAKASGATPVYVVNYAQFGAGGLPGVGTGGIGMMGNIGAVATAAGIGTALGTWLSSIYTNYRTENGDTGTKGPGYMAAMARFFSSPEDTATVVDYSKKAGGASMVDIHETLKGIHEHTAISAQHAKNKGVNPSNFHPLARGGH